jgi:hypothetical protein
MLNYFCTKNLDRNKLFKRTEANLQRAKDLLFRDLFFVKGNSMEKVHIIYEPGPQTWSTGPRITSKLESLNS